MTLFRGNMRTNAAINCTFISKKSYMRMGMFWKKSNGIVQINEKDSLRRSVLEIKTQRAY